MAEPCPRCGESLCGSITGVGCGYDRGPEHYDSLSNNKGCRDYERIETAAAPRTTRTWSRAKKFTLGPGCPALEIAEVCAPYSGTEGPDADSFEIYVRRRGKDKWLLKYPAFEITPEGNALFLFDQKLFHLPPGRYEAELRQDALYGSPGGNKKCGTVCGVIELVLPGPCRLDPLDVALVRATKTVIHDGEVEVPNPIFDDVADFLTELCSVLEADACVLPLSNADRDTLCNAVLCCQPELIIFDDLRSEVVRFEGCEDGQVKIVRGVGGSGPFKFPRGAQVGFSWTPNNVAKACEGCPDDA